MKVAAILLVTLLAVSADPVAQFEEFIQRFEKSYSHEEYRHRFSIFVDNLKKIDYMNALNPDATYGINEHADLTEEEFADARLGMAAAPSNEEPIPTPVRNGLPTSWDWRDHGAVTPVKNQGQCGSCWSFSTSGAVEGAWYLKHGKLVSLSEQQMVDCDKVDQGCNGGLPANAYKYIEQAGGLETESDYPYEAVDDTCRFNKSRVVAQVNGYKAISKDENEIAQALYDYGPLSIGINASWMQFYTGGIADPWICSSSKLDHGVLIVGYGTDSGKDYWIIKNSWGPSWGEKGYYYIVRGKGKCGLNQMVTVPTVP